MSVKRRDSKNRILRDGESQDKKTKRYVYTYYVNGKQQKLYSWKLEPTDRLPTGKRDCVSLREKIAELKKKSALGLVSTNMTVSELVDKYTKTRNDVKATTRMGYNTVKNLLVKDEFGSKQITKITTSDAKLWLTKLQKEDGKSYSSIHTIRGVLRPAFQMAVEDDTLMKNPFGFPLKGVIKNDSVTRDALTEKQERDFLSFVKNDSHFCKYYDAIFVLFKTGMRISEFCGLTVKDIDLVERKINIDHQLLRVGMSYMIETTKSKYGKRILHIVNEEVYECCKRMLNNRVSPKKEPMIDGYAGFLYLDKNGMPTVAMHWEHYFNHIVEKYNKIYKVQMPNVTPHICRHTCCTNLVRKGMPPKAVQNFMGHSEIAVTLNYYTHYSDEDVKKELERLERLENNDSSKTKKSNRA